MMAHERPTHQHAGSPGPEDPPVRAALPTGVILRGREQSAIGLLVLLALAALIVLRVALGGWRGEALVEVDRAARRTARYRVDVNRAGWTELAQLPGIGETLAKRIIQFRRRHGPLTTNQTLLEVHGIGEQTLAALLPHLQPLPGDARRSAVAPRRDRGAARP